MRDAAEKPLRAYHCRSDDAEHTEIRFAATNTAARRGFLAETDVEDAEVRRAPEFDGHAPGPVPVSALFEAGWWFECHHCSRRLSQDEEFIDDHPASEILDSARREAPHVLALARFDAENPEPEPAAEGAAHAERWAAEQAARNWHERRRELSWRVGPRALSRGGLRILDETGEVFCDATCQWNAAAYRAGVEHAQDEALAEAERRWPGCGPYEVTRWPYLSASVSFKAPGMEYPARWSAAEDDLFVAQHDAAAWDAYVATLAAKERTAA